MIVHAVVEDVVVQANMTLLDGDITDVATQIKVIHPIFIETNTVRIGAEEITLGPTADGGYTFTGCTRHANGTSAAAHKSGQEVGIKGGASVVSFAFGGTEYYSMMRVSGNVAFTAGVIKDGVVQYKPKSIPADLEKVFPSVRYQVGAGITFGVSVWLRADEAEEAAFSGIIQG